MILPYIAAIAPIITAAVTAIVLFIYVTEFVIDNSGLEYRSRELLNELKEKEAIKDIDKERFEATLDSQDTSDENKAVLEYLRDRIFFDYSQPVLHPQNDYSNYFNRLVTMCDEDFEQISFDPDSGLIIDDEVFYEFSTFLAFPDSGYGNYSYSDQHLYQKRGSSSNEIHRVVEVFNRALEDKGKQKRFLFENRDNQHYYRGRIWYGKPENIREIVEKLDLEVELYTDHDEEPVITRK